MGKGPGPVVLPISILMASSFFAGTMALLSDRMDDDVDNSGLGGEGDLTFRSGIVKIDLDTMAMSLLVERLLLKIIFINKHFLGLKKNITSFSH